VKAAGGEYISQESRGKSGADPENLRFFVIFGSCQAARRLRDIKPRPVPDFMWDEPLSVKVFQNNIEAWCCKIEKLIAERKKESVHFQHIQNFLRISHDNAVVVCDRLVSDGVLGPYDMATERYPVLNEV